MDLFDWVTMPVLGPVRMVQWLGEQLIDAAETELYDEDRVQGGLLELQAQYDMDEVSEEEYRQREDLLLERLNAIRKAKE
ncbi:MAG: gas vesicle protein GvpG [Dehalococcoidia bacterium]|nr:gas vesicle protein GvpG [Dehalococcoidia bacterium]